MPTASSITTGSHTTRKSSLINRSEEQLAQNAEAVSEGKGCQNLPQRRDKDEDLDDDGIEDGGRKGWICVVGGWFALFATFGWLNSYVSLPIFLIKF